MRYFVSAGDPEVRSEFADSLEREGLDVVDEYDENAVVVSLGGDGAVLYNARRFGRPTILPVRVGRSEGNRIQLDRDSAVERIHAIETGSEGDGYRIERHHKIAAFVGGEEVRGSFGALNDVQLHHPSPVRAAKFAVRVTDDGVVFEAERAIGDGLVVATPFGATAYFEAITGGSFESGIGVAFNNVHRPDDAPHYLVLGPEATVEFEPVTTRHGSPPLLARDDDPDPYELPAGERVTVRRTDRPVEILRVSE